MTTEVHAAPRPGHAAVLGGSMAGLLAASALARHFAQVTVVERDAAPAAPEHRKGVPQDQHIHVLLQSGATTLERFFPGLTQELVAAGAVTFDCGSDARWFHHGVWKVRDRANVPLLAQSRPFLEWHVRRRLSKLPNVAFVVGDAAELLTRANGQGRSEVSGVRVRRRDGSDVVDDISADLVVETGGRGSHVPQWLEAMGYPKPPEENVVIDLGYATRTYQRPPASERDWQMLLVYAKAPHGTRTGIVSPIEGDRWIVTLSGCLKDYPPSDDAGFLEFARSLERPDLYDAIKHAKPLSPITTIRFPAQRRRHYEKLRRFPDGLVVLGDAMCSFNPLYGQGMSVAALEAEALSDCLRERADLTGLPRRFFRRAARIVDAPWMLATGADFLYPGAAGKRPAGTGVLGWYNVNVLELSGQDPQVQAKFLEVMHLTRSPFALFSPAVLLPVLGRALGFVRLAPASQPDRVHDIN
jgi:2-polyprenyl-6-methoxyphenol hydroxylase-like FAD-dependent oxidoreductase